MHPGKVISRRPKWGGAVGNAPDFAIVSGAVGPLAYRPRILQECPIVTMPVNSFSTTGATATSPITL
jgi:hypothetical protein